jgi:hypothetical protein
MIGRRPAAGRRVEANRRLTALTGAVLLVLLGAETLTVPDVRQHLPQHLFLGLLLVPPVALKLASAGYRFARYYLGDPAYRRAGPPPPAMRLAAPLVVLATLAVLVTGLELWLFGLRFGARWITAHELSAYAWFVAMAIHVFGYLERAGQEVAADVRPGPDVAGRVTRRSLLGASLFLGLVLGLVTVLWPGPFVVFST